MLNAAKQEAWVQKVIDLLATDSNLPTACRLHKLTGTYTGLWECHIAPDWLLIYEFDNESNALDLMCTGTHADLF
jgi:mRNA interferase YafQ